MILERTNVRTREVGSSASEEGTRSGERCPTPEELVNYVLGALEVEPAMKVQSHLSGCPKCQMEAEALQDALESMIAPTQ
jgi:hypothetical protein